MASNPLPGQPPTALSPPSSHSLAHSASDTRVFQTFLQHARSVPSLGPRRWTPCLNPPPPGDRQASTFMSLRSPEAPAPWGGSHGMGRPLPHTLPLSPQEWKPHDGRDFYLSPPRLSHIWGTHRTLCQETSNWLHAGLHVSTRGAQLSNHTSVINGRRSLAKLQKTNRNEYASVSLIFK